MDDVIPMIGQKKPEYPDVELPAVFSVALFFINHKREMRTISFNCPPGVYPNPEWMPTLIKEATREGARALKLETKDLSWRPLSANEFVQVTTRNTAMRANGGAYKDPYEAGLELDKEETAEDDNNSN